MQLALKELRKCNSKSLLCSALFFITMAFMPGCSADESRSGSNLYLVSPGIAGHTANAIGDKLSEAKLAGQGSPIDVWLTYDQGVVLMAVANTIEDDSLKKMANVIARVILGREDSQIKSLTVLFYDPNNPSKFRKVLLDSSQLKAALNDSSDNYIVTSGERVSNGGAIKPAAPANVAILVPSTNSATSMAVSTRTISPAASAAIAPVPFGQAKEHLSSGGSEPQSSYPAERSKLVVRIQALQAKRVGVQPFYTELGRIDEYYKASDLGKVTYSVNRLNNILAEQENQLKSLQGGSSGRGGNTASRKGAGPIDNTAPTPDEDLLGGNKAISDFRGTDADLAKQVIKTIIARELGPDSPAEGPFLLERLRIGRRIQELEKSGGKVEGYRYYMKQKVEALVVSRDVRRLTELRDNVIYIQQQLGLPPLKSGHLNKNMF